MDELQAPMVRRCSRRDRYGGGGAGTAAAAGPGELSPHSVAPRTGTPALPPGSWGGAAGPSAPWRRLPLSPAEGARRRRFRRRSGALAELSGALAAVPGRERGRRRLLLIFAPPAAPPRCALSEPRPRSARRRPRHPPARPGSPAAPAPQSSRHRCWMSRPGLRGGAAAPVSGERVGLGIWGWGGTRVRRVATRGRSCGVFLGALRLGFLGSPRSGEPRPLAPGASGTPRIPRGVRAGGRGAPSSP